MTRLEELKASRQMTNEQGSTITTNTTPTRLDLLKATRQAEVQQNNFNVQNAGMQYAVKNNIIDNTQGISPQRIEQDKLQKEKDKNLLALAQSGNTGSLQGLSAPDIQRAVQLEKDNNMNQYNNLNNQVLSDEVKNYKENPATFGSNLKNNLIEPMKKNIVQTGKTLGTSVLDASVNTVEFVKNAFRDQMVDEERKAWYVISVWANPNNSIISRMEKNMGRKMTEDEKQAYAQEQINNATAVLKKYNVKVPENVTSEYAKSQMNELTDWAWRENKLEESTRKLNEKVQLENQDLGTAGKIMTQTAGTIGNMGPSIISNAILPGSGLAPMFANATQGAYEQAKRDGASHDDSLTYGLLNGGIEIGSEVIGGEGVANATGIPTLLKNNGKTVISKIAKDVLAEGIEEMIAEPLEEYAKRVYDKDAGYKSFEEFASSIGEAFASSILPTLILGGGSYVSYQQNLNNAINQTQETVEKGLDRKLTANEAQELKNQIIDRISRENATATDALIDDLTDQAMMKKMQNTENNSEGLEDSSSFSLPETDSMGRKLSSQQQEYFKDSKVRDENGNLKTVYHGTTSSFNVFKYDFLEKNGTGFGKGFYFTDKLETAKSYSEMGEKGKVIEAYVDITRPLKLNQKTISKEQYKKFVEVVNEKTNGTLFADYLGEYVKKGTKQYNEILNDILKDYEYGGDDIDLVSGILNSANLKLEEGYKILKDTVGYDGIIVNANEGDKVLGNVYIPFQSNQIKNVDNLNPTSNEDIRYSQSNNQWQEYLNKNWDLMPDGTKTFGFPTNEQLQNFENAQNKNAYESLNGFENQNNAKRKKASSLEDIADMTEESVELPKAEYKYEKDKNTAKQRKFFENVESSKIIAEEVKEKVNTTSYEVQSNMEMLESAKKKLDKNINEVASEWLVKDVKKFNAEDVAMGAILIERYQQNREFSSAANVVQKLADAGTYAGRTVQMFSIFQRLSPETMMLFEQKQLNKAFEEIKKSKTGEWVKENQDRFKLTEDDTKFIYEQVEKAQQATDESTKQRELSKIEERINDKLPPEKGQTIKTLRRIAMLFNPKTQVRNVVGNTLIMPVNAVGDFIGTQIDKAIAKKTGIRTTNYTNLKNLGEGAIKGIKDAVTDYKTGTRTTESGSRFELEIGAKPFNENTKFKSLNAINNKLNGINNLLSAVMSGGDRPFYEAAYKNSLEGQMKADNVTAPTQEMIDIAVNEALQRTWNDNNGYTEAVLGIRRYMNKLNISGFGLGDLIIPFAKTPANLTKAMVEYSPLGFIDSYIKGNDLRKAISRGEMTAQQQKNFVNSTSKAIAGTLLYVIAGTLAKSGAITGSADKDKDVKNFEQNVLGIQPYSIKIGDKTYTYSWANPLNVPLAIMADTYKMSKENASKWEIITNAFKVGGEVLVENSFLQGIKELFEADSITEGLVKATENAPASFILTLFSQIASATDKTKRQTFEYGNEFGSMINGIKYKLPGIRNSLAPQVNTFGEEIENQNGLFNTFLNPANVREAVATDTQKELYALYEVTKDTTIFPRQAPYYISGGGEKINLSSEDRAKYQKISGNYVSETLDALFDSNFYKSLEDNQKVEIVNKIVSDADTLAKDEWIDTKATEDLKKTLSKLEDVPLVDYYNAWLSQKDVTGTKNAKGQTINGSVKNNKIKAINNAIPNLTSQERKILYGIFNLD